MCYPTAFEIYAHKVTLTDITTAKSLLVMRNLSEECMRKIKTQWRPRLCEKTNCAFLSEAQLRLSYSRLPQGSEGETIQHGLFYLPT